MIKLLLVTALTLAPQEPNNGWALTQPPAPAGWPKRPDDDWLLARTAALTRIFRVDDHSVSLSNGLVQRTWRVDPHMACIAFDDLTRGEALLRAVEPEARIAVDGNVLDVGGLHGQPDRAYLRPEWLETLQPRADALHFRSLRPEAIATRVPWKYARHAALQAWPPTGQGIVFEFTNAQGTEVTGINVEVHYELYDGLPLFAKWLVIRNDDKAPLTLDSFEVERLALVEGEATVEPQERWRKPLLHVESDFAFHGMSSESADVTTHWLEDPEYTTQVSYALHTPCLLVSKAPLGPAAVLAPGESFTTYRVFELALDTDDRERSGLAQRRMYRALAPWVTENPLLFHCTRSDSEGVKQGIDQAAECGFEMVILSFGSGFDVEDGSDANLARAEELAGYAKTKGVELGSYSLLASRSIDAANDALDKDTLKPGKAYFGNSPCLESEWGRSYFAKLRAFYESSGFSVLEHDGSYPGDACASSAHPGHAGLADSQWKQWRAITDFYAWCRGRGIYLNVPDWYFLAGSSKTGMGYRETNWSLPRAEQLVHARQNIFDGTWTKTPSMGWMFVPLTEYHGGGAAATLEPLAEHLADYEQHLALNFGAGVQACWRGPRLYDTDATRDLVKKWVAWFKRHREILESDIVHVRRADGRDLDAWLHVNPRAKERALAMVFNPRDVEASRTFDFPLYYAGLTSKALARERDGDAREIELDARQQARLEVTLPARGFTWFVFEVR